MNDFTKEELIALFLEINIAIRHWGDAEEYKNYPKLRDKIQSMIDNYCDLECNNHDCLDKVCGKCRRLIG